MKRVKAIFPIFSVLFVFSLFIVFFLQNPLTAGLEMITLPIQTWAFKTAVVSQSLTADQQLQKENNELRMQLTQMQEIQKDNQALHDQFQTTNPSPQSLLPANIIGMQQHSLLIDKGNGDHLHIGAIVVVKNNLIGKITKVTAHLSLVTLLNDPSTSFTAETEKTSSAGIVKSLDGSIVFGNVVLSDKLEKNDIVMTKGSLDMQGNGYPSGFIIGKIMSVDKEASNLFQSAKIQSLVDISQQRVVFVMVR